MGGEMEATLDRMAQQRKAGRGGKEDRPQEPPKKEVLYVEMEATLKRRLVRLAELPTRRRKLTTEAIMAIERYVEEEERKEKLPPLD
jgi:hypothetical protein